MENDLISRAALINQHCAVNCGCTRSQCGFTKEEDGADCCTFVKEIEAAPSVEAEPVRHGRWVLKHIGYGHCWMCSVCLKNPCIYVTEDTNYCPNCGAKMDAKEDA